MRKLIAEKVDWWESWLMWKLTWSLDNLVHRRHILASRGQNDLRKNLGHWTTSVFYTFWYLKYFLTLWQQFTAVSCYLFLKVRLLPKIKGSVIRTKCFLFSGEDRSILVKYIRQSVNELGQSVFECSLCGFNTLLSKRNVLNHVESKHFNGRFTYTCEYCYREHTTKNALDKHVSRHHNTKNNDLMWCYYKLKSYFWLIVLIPWII